MAERLAAGTVKLYMTHVRKYVDVTYKKKIRLKNVQKRPELTRPHKEYSYDTILSISNNLKKHKDYLSKTSS